MTPKAAELFVQSFSRRETLHLPGPVYFEKLTEEPVTTKFQGGVWTCTQLWFLLYRIYWCSVILFLLPNGCKENHRPDFERTMWPSDAIFIIDLIKNPIYFNRPWFFGLWRGSCDPVIQGYHQYDIPKLTDCKVTPVRKAVSEQMRAAFCSNTWLLSNQLSLYEGNPWVDEYLPKTNKQQVLPDKIWWEVIISSRSGVYSMYTQEN